MTQEPSSHSGGHNGSKSSRGAKEKREWPQGEQSGTEGGTGLFGVRADGGGCIQEVVTVLGSNLTFVMKFYN